MPGEGVNPVATLTVTDNSADEADGLDIEYVTDVDSDTEVVTGLYIVGIGIISGCWDNTSLPSLVSVCGLETLRVSVMSFLLSG